MPIRLFVESNTSSVYVPIEFGVIPRMSVYVVKFSVDDEKSSLNHNCLPLKLNETVKRETLFSP